MVQWLELCAVSTKDPGSITGQETKIPHAPGWRPGFSPWDRKIPWRREWQPTPVFCLENSMDRGAWYAIVHGRHKESEMTE